MKLGVKRSIDARDGDNIDYSLSNKALGLMLPLSSDGRLFRQTYTTEQQAISNLKNLVLTRKGERYGQPSFGTRLYSLLFEPVSDEVEFEVKVREEIMSAVGFWLPSISIDTVNVMVNPDVSNLDNEHAVAISINFGISGVGVNREVVVYSSESGDLEVVEI